MPSAARTRTSLITSTVSLLSGPLHVLGLVGSHKVLLSFSGQQMVFISLVVLCCVVVFKPIFASAKMCINPNAEQELRSPKATFNLEVQNIAVEMTKAQVRLERSRGGLRVRQSVQVGETSSADSPAR